MTIPENEHARAAAEAQRQYETLPGAWQKIPKHVGAVEGCNCGGGNGWHLAPDFWRDTPGCSINELPDEERMAAEDAARERLLAYSDSISKGWLT